MNAVETLGADKAVPSKILEHMGPIAAGLTRQNVASHLQKYRTRKRTQNDFCKAAAYCPPTAYHCWSPFTAPCAMIGVRSNLLSAMYDVGGSLSLYIGAYQNFAQGLLISMIGLQELSRQWILLCEACRLSAPACQALQKVEPFCHCRVFNLCMSETVVWLLQEGSLT